jgi:hypothetical protein
MEAQGERRYSSYSFMTSALDGVSGQRHSSAAFYPRRKDLRHPLDRKLGGPRADLDTEARGKILSPLLGINMSETSVNFHETTQCKVSEDGHLHTRRRDNLKSY